jgi:hypothetical protein
MYRDEYQRSGKIEEDHPLEEHSEKMFIVYIEETKLRLLDKKEHVPTQLFSIGLQTGNKSSDQSVVQWLSESRKVKTT